MCQKASEPQEVDLITDFPGFFSLRPRRSKCPVHLRYWREKYIYIYVHICIYIYIICISARDKQSPRFRATRQNWTKFNPFDATWCNSRQSPHFLLLMAEIMHQLRLVVTPIIYKVLYIQTVVGLGISEPSTVSILSFLSIYLSPSRGSQYREVSSAAPLIFEAHWSSWSHVITSKLIWLPNDSFM